MNAYTEEKPCNLCGSARFRTLYEFPAGLYPHAQFDTASWDGRQMLAMRIVECTDCGLRYSSPSFREEFLHLVYPPDVIHSPEKIRASFNLDGRKVNSILSAAARHCRPGATLLDVGTRYGALPYVASRKYGFDAHGIEFNAASVERARLHFSGVSQGTVEDIPSLTRKLNWDRLDVIVLDDVVEHLVDPRRDLEKLAATQRAGDLLLLRTMDCSSWGARIFRSNWYYYAPAAHMFYFDERSLGRLLERTGYVPIEVHQPSLARSVYRAARARLVGMKKRIRSRSKKGAVAPVARRPSQLVARRRLDADMFLMIARRA